MIRFSCPNCKQVYQHATAGYKFYCSKCGQRMQVPAPPAPLPGSPKTVLGNLEDAQPSRDTLSPSTPPPRVPVPAIEIKLQGPPSFGPPLFHPPEDDAWHWTDLWRPFSGFPYSLALLFFFLPWVSISCDIPSLPQKPWVTQSGFQAIYGDFTVPAFLEPEVKRTKDIEVNDVLAHASICMLGYLGLLVFALIFALTLQPSRNKATLLTCLSVSLLLTLIVQCVLGFPIERRIRAATSPPARGDPVAWPGHGGVFDFRGEDRMALALLLNVHYTPWFWFGICLILLAPAWEFVIAYMRYLPRGPRPDSCL